jgi:hypothetical protein
MKETYLKPTKEAGRNFIMRKIPENVVMLNLLRFREIADYSNSPELMPEKPISGEKAYRRKLHAGRDFPDKLSTTSRL